MIRRLLLLLITLLAPAALAASADLAVKPVGTLRVPPSQPYFFVTLRNLGPDPAMNVVVSASLPCADPCTFDTLLSGQERSLAISLPESRRAGQSYDVEVRLSSATPDPDLTNNSTTVHVEISDAPDLYCYVGPASLIAEDDRRDPGLPFALPLAFGNRARFDAHDVVLTADFDPRITLTGASSPACAITGSRMTCHIGDVPALTDRYDLAIEGVNPPLFDGGVSLPFTLSIAGREDDLHPEDNTQHGELRLRRTLLVTSPDDAGDGTLRDTIERANASCTPYTACKVAFRLPAGAARIAPRSELPPLRAPMIVDGNTQTRLDGRHIALTGGSGSGSGFTIESCSEIRSLAISGFPVNGVTVNAAPCIGYGQSILGCTITGNERGVFIASGSTTVQDNVIAENRRSAVFAWSGEHLLVNHNELRGNGASGVYTHVAGSSITRNVISGNTDFGIAVDRQAPFVDMDGNRLFDNGQRGIDVGLDGPGSPLHTEPPTLTRAVYDAVTDVTTVDGVPGRFHVDHTSSFSFQLFASAKADPRGAAETVLHVINNNFPLQVQGDLTGKFITATQDVWDSTTFAKAPSPDSSNEYASRETSELSAPVEVQR